MSKKTYRQAKLSFASGSVSMVAWIEAGQAKKGGFVRCEETGSLWRVDEVYSGIRTAEEASERAHEHTHFGPSLGDESRTKRSK